MPVHVKPGIDVTATQKKRGIKNGVLQCVKHYSQWMFIVVRDFGDASYIMLIMESLQNKF